MSLPQKIARYEILGRLASGGMAEILLARLTGPSGFERAVVVKRILPHLASEEAFRTMFLDEARIVAGIRHPNVVQVQELGMDGEELFLAMEYLEGESASTLSRRLRARNEALDLSLAAYIVAQVCAGLHAAHELKSSDGKLLQLVHRDISPQNIVITYGGEVKVLDFGIAKVADRVTRTETGTFKGKFEYASPEQCLGLPLDRKSDIFALGVVLYELTTGRRLFRRDSHLFTMRAITQGEVPPPSSIVPGYPSSLEDICMRALAVDPVQRYSTTSQMRSDLVRVARELDQDPEPELTLARLMVSLFQDRIDEKAELLRRVSRGGEIGSLPDNESDRLVEIPVVEATLRATTTQRDVSATAPPAQARTRRRAALALFVAIPLLAAGVGLLQELRPKEPARRDVQQAAPAPPIDITVSISTSPPGATVMLDGVDRGKTPLTLTTGRTAARSNLELRLDGYEPSQQSFTGNVDQNLVISLVAKPAAPAPSTLASPLPRRDVRKAPSAAPKPKAKPVVVAPTPPPAPTQSPAQSPEQPPAFRRFE